MDFFYKKNHSRFSDAFHQCSGSVLDMYLTACRNRIRNTDPDLVN